MKAFVIVGVVLLAIVAVLLVAASCQPDSFRVARSASIQAAPDKVFALINDLQRWKGWSPWERMDPELRRSYGGAQAGKGAHYAWKATRRWARAAWRSPTRSPPRT